MIFSILISSSVHSNLLVFKDLDFEDYVSEKQIHSLYSQWSNKYREGTMKPPPENSIKIMRMIWMKTMMLTKKKTVSIKT